ncbi:hypothetical protein DDQ50_06220 [Amnibacterium flavum]|uniref:FHA domain-containing protein n=1 Tax=Amnibacterium flavum TaxID=2173173 RepID=A0A2V1HWT5_9MICO|nr:hypothetical protein DDQ50_06220 [Amnibacterium flavum]
MQQETAAQPVVAPPSVAPSTDFEPEPVLPVPAAVVPAPAVAPETATPVPDEPEAAPGDWTLEIDGADFGSIPDVLVLGRAPNAAVPGARLLPVSGGGTVSATHAVLRRDGDAVTLEDLGSTNGTAVVVGDGRELLPPHQAVRITETVDVWLAHARLRLRRS